MALNISRRRGAALRAQQEVWSGRRCLSITIDIVGPQNNLAATRFPTHEGVYNLSQNETQRVGE